MTPTTATQKPVDARKPAARREAPEGGDVAFWDDLDGPTDAAWAARVNALGAQPAQASTPAAQPQTRDA